MEYLSRKGIEFDAKDIRADPAYVKELVALGSRVTPTLVLGDRVMSGFDPAQLDAWLAEEA